VARGPDCALGLQLPLFAALARERARPSEAKIDTRAWLMGNANFLCFSRARPAVARVRSHGPVGAFKSPPHRALTDAAARRWVAVWCGATRGGGASAVRDNGGARARAPCVRSSALQLGVPLPLPARSTAHQLHPVLLPHEGRRPLGRSTGHQQGRGGRGPRAAKEECGTSALRGGPGGGRRVPRPPAARRRPP
jgi:hypothetical protein